MALSDPKEILLAHDRWASRQIIEACGKLSDEQFHQRFEMGPGSLHDTLVHMMSALGRWTDHLVGREPRPQLNPAVRKTPAELLALLEETMQALTVALHAHPLEGVVSRELGGKLYTFTRGAVLTHVATHGMHHRAQCLNMLRHLGVDPLPPSSVMQWTFLGE